jgi:hypothetical protein
MKELIEYLWNMPANDFCAYLFFFVVTLACLFEGTKQVGLWLTKRSAKRRERDPF